MFQSKEKNAPQFLNNITLSKLNETCNAVYKITSTPRNSHASSFSSVLSPAIARRITPRRFRYSLSEPTEIATSDSLEPLISTLHISDETKSFCLSCRIAMPMVTKEFDRRNELQELTSPEYQRQSIGLLHNKNTDVETNKKPEKLSKRIDSSEELKTKIDTEKIKADLHYGIATTTKRSRVDDIPSDSLECPPAKQLRKKSCVDEITASKSSSDFSMFNKNILPSSLKKSIQSQTEFSGNIGQEKLVTAGTQTLISMSPKIRPREESPEISENVHMEPPCKNNLTLQIFENKALDTYRQIRLAQLAQKLFETETTNELSRTSILPIPKSTQESSSITPLLNTSSLTQISDSTDSSNKSISKKSVTIPATQTLSSKNSTDLNKTDTSKPSIGIELPPETSAKSTPAITSTSGKSLESSAIVLGPSIPTTTTIAASTSSKTEPSSLYYNAIPSTTAASLTNPYSGLSFGSNLQSTLSSFSIMSTTTASATPIIHFGTPAAPRTSESTAPIKFGGQSTASPTYNNCEPKNLIAPVLSATTNPTFGIPQLSKPSFIFGGTTAPSSPVFGGGSTTTTGNNISAFGAVPVHSGHIIGSVTAAPTTFGSATTIPATPTFGSGPAIPVTILSPFGSTDPTSTLAFSNTQPPIAPNFATNSIPNTNILYGEQAAMEVNESIFFEAPAQTISVPTTNYSSLSNNTANFGNAFTPMFHINPIATFSPPSAFVSPSTKSASIPAFGCTQPSAALSLADADMTSMFVSPNNTISGTIQQEPMEFCETLTSSKTLKASAQDQSFSFTTSGGSATAFVTTNLPTFNFGSNEPGRATTRGILKSTLSTPNAPWPRSTSSCVGGTNATFGQTAKDTNNRPTFNFGTNEPGTATPKGILKSTLSTPNAPWPRSALSYLSGTNATNGTANLIHSTPSAGNKSGITATSSADTLKGNVQQSSAGAMGSNVLSAPAPFVFGATKTDSLKGNVQQSSVGAMGSNALSAPAPFVFGATKTGGSSTFPASLGSVNSTPNFGAAASASQGASATPTVPTITQPGVGTDLFNMGSSSTRKSRQQLKSRRGRY